MDVYNLDVIISVGYRVNSRRGTQFRIWATTVLRDHLVRGYSINERRLRELRLSLRTGEDALRTPPSPQTKRPPSYASSRSTPTRSTCWMTTTTSG